MSRKWVAIVGVLVTALVAGGARWLVSRPAGERTGSRPASWAEPMAPQPGLENLHRVSGGLFRGAQPAPEGFAELERLGIRTVVNLRTFHEDGEACNAAGLRCLRITMQAWEGEEEEVVEFLRLVADPENHPVFVHCLHGADRTGVATAAYRLAVQGWSKDEAIAEMTEGGYGFHSIWHNLIQFVRDLDVEAVKRKAGLAPAPAVG